jgi:hypothetical protein
LPETSAGFKEKRSAARGKSFAAFVKII